MAAASQRFEPVLAAALLSAGAAAIHASVAGPHFGEHFVLGALFVVTAIAQAAWAVLVLTAPSAPLLAAGVVGNIGVVAAWALSRTIGLPFGPDPWAPEPVAALDLAATSFEVVVVAAVILAAGGPYRPVSGRAAKRFATVGAVVIAALTSAAYAGTPGGAAGHHHGRATHDEVETAKHANAVPQDR